MNLTEDGSAPLTVRKRSTTTHLTEPVPSRQFFEQNFPEVLTKGQEAAARIGAILSGHRVRRSYFLPSNEVIDRPPLIIEVGRVTVEEAGIVRIYDKTETVREFPALVFNFFYREDGKAVICSSPEYTVLLERVD
jgi:hypothetical protein